MGVVRHSKRDFPCEWVSKFEDRMMDLGLICMWYW